MKPGKIVGRFSVFGKRGKRIKVVFRCPKMSDAKEALRFVNRTRDEADFLGVRRHETLETEKKFLADCLKQKRKRKSVFLFAEADGKIIGCASILPKSVDSMQHVGEFGIMLLEEFTGFGIGSRLAKRVLSIAKKETKFRIIKSGYFSKNKASGALHKKLGFKKYGELPNGAKLKKGGYDNLVHVFKEIRK